MGTAGRSAPLRRAGSLLGLLGLELGAVLALHWLGRFPGLRIRWDQPVPWVLSSPVQEVLGSVLRTVGLVMAYWLLASTVLYLLASLTRLPSAVRAVGWATLPLARRVADHAVAVTLATSMVGGTTLGVAGPALAADRGGGMGPPARKPVAAAQATGSSGQDQPSSTTETTGPPAPRYVPDPADQVPTSGSETTAPPSTAPKTTEPPATHYVPEPADQAPRRLPASGQPATSEAPTTTEAPSTTEAPTRTEAPTTTEAPATTQAPTTTTAAPTTTKAPATEAPATTEAPAANASTTTQGGAPPTTAATPAPPATRKGTAAPTTTHAYEFNPATTSTSRPPQEPGEPNQGSSNGGNNPGGGQGPGNEPGGGGDTRSDEKQPYQVVRGDNLWTIARDHLRSARSGGSGEPTNREVAEYWAKVVEANSNGLRSGDPDLIYPDEKIALPPAD